jgi:hypothetical protein
MERDAKKIIARCNELKTFWAPRDAKMRQWYRLIQMIDDLKTEKMESFVGNDPRAIYNLVLHMLDTPVPHRLANPDVLGVDAAAVSVEVTKFFDTAWQDAEDEFRHNGPRQSLKRSLIGTLLATGWYSVFSIIYDNGEKAFLDLWSPIQVYPMWDMEMGLSECAHITTCTATAAKHMQRRNAWIDLGALHGDQTIHDYWWVEVGDAYPFTEEVWNASVVAGKLVKYEKTRFRRIPIYVAPVGGLPDTGPLSEGSSTSTASSSASTSKGDRWKEEIGQSIIATNENIYKAWNKWWTFSLQLLRDTAQPRIFERSRSGKAIVKPEDVFRRGAIFRGGADDAVEFIGAPPMPLELRSTQLDLEAMMQRGGVSWAMYGNVTGELTAYVMSQISASANQVMKPYLQSLQNLYADIDNGWLEDIQERGVAPYGWSPPAKLPDDAKITANFEVEIPGDLIQRATAARMIDPEFALSYTYVVNKLFPEIKNPLQERAQRLADMAELSPENATIAKIRYYRKQAAALAVRDADVARLYDLAADAAEAMLNPLALQAGKDKSRTTAAPGNRPENAPKSTTEAQMPL